MAENFQFNFRETARAIETLAVAGGDEFVSGMRVIGEVILTDVKTSRAGAGVPKDEGTLMSSLRAEGPNWRQQVKLIAGGASAPYALIQHERTDYNHESGEARYWIRGLERFQSGQSGNPQKMMEEIGRKALKRASKGVPG